MTDERWKFGLMAVETGEIADLYDMERQIFQPPDAFSAPGDFSGYGCSWIIMVEEKKAPQRIGYLATQRHFGPGDRYESESVSMPNVLWVVSIGVLEPHRRKGAARFALKFVQKLVNPHLMADEALRVNTAIYHARASNVASIGLAEEVGFRYVRLMPDYYQLLTAQEHTNREDGVLLAYVPKKI